MSQSAPHEVELKLEFDPSDAADLKDRILPTLGKGGEAEHLVSVYYDTPKHRLHAHGLTLRVRSVGDRRVQTVKRSAGASVGLFDRSEWETELAGTEPDLEAAARTPVRRALAKRHTALSPVFETVVDRTTWVVETKRSTIEVVLDLGRVAAKGASRPLAELEFELKRGPVSDLFRLARRLDGTPSLRTAVSAKSERGYALLLKETPLAFKAEPIAIAPGETTARAFQIIMQACIRQFRLNEPVLIETRAPEALHQARVAMRRLRSALSLFRSVIGDDRLDSLKVRLRAISRDLGEARNLDVYVSHAPEADSASEGTEPGLADFLAQLETRRRLAYDRIVKTLQAKPFRRLMLDLLEWIETGPWMSDQDPLRKAGREQPIEAFAAAILAARRRKVKKGGRRLAQLDPAARHRVRIQAKKLRYASEFFAGLLRGRREKDRHATFIAALEQLQGHLGDLNDIQTGHEMAADFAKSTETEGVPKAGSAVFAAAHISGLRDARIEDLLEAAAGSRRDLLNVKRFWSRWSEVGAGADA